MNKGLAAVKKTVIRVLCIIMVSAIAVHAGSARAEIQVQTTLLEDLGSWRSFAHDINNAGQIVGYGYLVPGLRHAFSWENGALTDLGPTLAYGINNAGQIVLMSSTKAYIVQGETRIDIGSLGAGVIAANAMSDSGQVVGISYLPNYLAHAFLWQDGIMIDLGALSDSSRSEAKAINNAGQIVGWSESDEGTRAFLWENGKMISLGTLGGNYSEARGINDKGQVVGFSQNSLGETHAFIWQDGRMTDLDPLDPTRPSMAYSINNQGQTVGSLGYIAAIWQYGTMDLLLPGGYYDFSDAYSINENGQVVGHKAYHAVLWTVTSSFDQLKTLAALLAGADMPDAIARDLQDRLDRTIKFLDAGNNNAACGNLTGFINEVRGVSGKQIPEDQADQILSSAQMVEDALQCR